MRIRGSLKGFLNKWLGSVSQWLGLVSQWLGLVSHTLPHQASLLNQPVDMFCFNGTKGVRMKTLDERVPDPV